MSVPNQGLIAIESDFELIHLLKEDEKRFLLESRYVYSLIKDELFKRSKVAKFSFNHEQKCIETISYLLKCMVKAIRNHEMNIARRLDFILSVPRNNNELSKLGVAKELKDILECMKDKGFISDIVNGYHDKENPVKSHKGYISFTYDNVKFTGNFVYELFRERKRKKSSKKHEYIKIQERQVKTKTVEYKNGRKVDKEINFWKSSDISRYEDTTALMNLQDITQKIEQHLKKYIYSIPVGKNFTSKDERYDYIVSYMSNQAISNNDDIKLYRVFHNDLNHSGRYYGKNHCNIPSECRKKILIDGKETIQLDFKSCVPSILYIMSGNKLSENQDLYHVDGLTIPREYIKSIFVCAVNASSENKAYQAIRHEILEMKKYSGNYLIDIPTNKVIKEWIEVVLSQYSYLKEYFFSPKKGLIAINKESEIITEVYLQCIERDIPVLDVYDCILCLKKDKECVRQIMKDSCIKVLGHELNISEG